MVQLTLGGFLTEFHFSTHRLTHFDLTEPFRPTLKVSRNID